MKNSNGFTHLEIIMMVVIVTLLAAMAVPQFLSSDSNARGMAVKGSEGAVRNAHAAAIADLKRFPEVRELADYVKVDGARARTDAGNKGIELSLLDDQDEQHLVLVVPTYTDQNCTTLTRAEDDPVACVGVIERSLYSGV